MQRIVDSIFAIEGLRLGRVYVVEAPDGLTLIDTSISGSLPQITRELQKAGHQLGEIKRIVLTHAHWDHFGSLAALSEATGSRVYAHYRYESAILRGEKKPLWPPEAQLKGFDRLVSRFWVQPHLRHEVAVKVDYELKEGDRLDEVWPGLVVVDEPGHSPGQCGFWLPEQHLLLGGDVMMRLPSGRFVLPMVAATPDLAEARRSIRKVAGMQPDIICLGHGRPYLGGAAAALQRFAAQLTEE